MYFGLGKKCLRQQLRTARDLVVPPLHANHVPQISEAIANAMKDSVPKDKQKEAVEVFMKENDTFVSLQTGYGRSTIYKLRSCIVVTPT